MGTRTTDTMVRHRAFALNALLRARGTDARFFAQRRNGYFELDEYRRVGGTDLGSSRTVPRRCRRTILAGSSGELYSALGVAIAALEALDAPPGVAAA